MIVTLDGDLQDDPAEIPHLLAKLDEGFDLVSGWKSNRRDPLRRRVLSRIFNAVTGWISGVHLHDMNCGLKAYRAEVVRGLRLYGELHRFIPVLAQNRGFRVAELPVNHRPREHGRSRYGLERYLRGFLDLLTVSFLGRYRNRPLHLFGGVGLTLSFAGTGILIYLTIDKLLGQRDRPAAAADPRRPARRRRHPGLLARADHRADHEPPRGALDRARAGRGARRRDPLLKVPLLRHLRAGYPRNAQVISCLRRAGVEVAERHVPVWEGREHKWSAGPLAALRLAGAESAAPARPREEFDALLVGYPGPSRPTRSAPRRTARARSSSTRSSRCRTRSSATAPAFRPAASPTGRCARSTVMRCAQPTWWSPTPPRTPSCSARSAQEASRSASSAPRNGSSSRGGREAAPALFVGKLIPLHGLETILAAARLAPDLRFRIVGSGPARPSARRPAGERGARALGRVRAAAGRAAPRRPARSGSSARRRRPRA